MSDQQNGSEPPTVTSAESLPKPEADRTASYVTQSDSEGTSFDQIESTISHETADATGQDSTSVSEFVKAQKDSPADRPTGGMPSSSAISVTGYEILSELGRGGMGVVFEAIHLKLNRKVALKMILGDTRMGHVEIIRFLAEGEAVAAIQHSNVLKVYDIGEDNGRPYMALEFCPGGSFKRVLETRSPSAGSTATWRIVVEQLQQIAAGVAAAHALGIVHRDLKPDNVLLDANGHPKVADFGIAKRGAGSDLTRTGVIMGTPAYMSPEQAKGDTKFVGPQADVWAIGVMLYEAITGTRPFDGSMQEILVRVQMVEPTPPSRVVANVPRDLELICLKCLSKLPYDRYPTAKELAEDLERFLRGQPISVRQAGAPERVWKWCRRYPSAAGLMLSLFLGITITFGLTLWALGERDRANGNATRAESASQLATQHLHQAQSELARAHIAGVRELRISKPLGWTWTGLEKLQAAVQLQTKAIDSLEVRSLAGSCLGRFDLRHVGFLDQIDTFTIAFSPDGKRVAVGNKRSAGKCYVVVHDTTTRKPVAEYFFWVLDDSFKKLLLRGNTNFQDGVSKLAFSPDGKWLVAGSRSGMLHRWDTSVANPNPISWRAFKPEKGVTGLIFTPDGRSLISSGPETMQWTIADGWKGTRLFDETFGVALSGNGRVLATIKYNERLVSLHSGRQWHVRSTPPVHAGSIALDPEGRTAAALSGGTIQLIDVANGRVRRTLRLPDSQGLGTDGIEFSPDGSLLVVPSGKNRVYVWEVATGEIVAELYIPDRSQPVAAFSPDGRYLAVAGDHRTYLYELRTAAVCSTLAHHNDPIKAIEFTPTGELMTLSEQISEDRVVGTSITTWNISSGQQVRARRLTNTHRDRRFAQALSALAVHPQDDQVATTTSILGPSTTTLNGPMRWPPFLETSKGQAPVVIRPEALLRPEHGAELLDDPRASTGRAIRLTSPPTLPTEGATSYIKKSNRPATVQATLAALKLPNLEGKWYYAGPFDNTAGKGFDTSYPPEQGIDFKATYTGKGGTKVQWNESPQFRTGEINDLGPLFPNNNSHAVVYLYHKFQSPMAYSWPLSFGSDDTLSVFMNGKRLHHEPYDRPAEPDQNIVTVQVKEGVNELLVKVCQGTDKWQVYVAPELPDTVPPAVRTDLERDFPSTNPNLRSQAGVRTGVKFRLPEICRTSRAKAWFTVVEARVERKGVGGPGIAMAVLDSAGRQDVRFVQSLQIPDQDYHLYACEGGTKADYMKSDWLEITVGLPEESADVEAVWIGGVFCYPVIPNGWPSDISATAKAYRYLTYSPDGSRLWAIEGDTHVVSWNTNDSKIATRWHDEVAWKWAGISPNVRSLIAGNQIILIGTEGGLLHALDPKTGQFLKQFGNKHESGIRSIALDPTETVAAIGTQKGKVQLVQLGTDEAAVELPAHDGSVESIQFSRDGNLLVTGSLDGTVRVWQKEGSTYRRWISLPSFGGELDSLKLSPDAAQLAILMKEAYGIKVWNLPTLRLATQELGFAEVPEDSR